MPPLLPPPLLQGTTCEPWMARGAITLLHELLLPGTAKALEWSAGSSTLWLLHGHVHYLVSIDHTKQVCCGGGVHCVVAGAVAAAWLNLTRWQHMGCNAAGSMSCNPSWRRCLARSTWK